MRLYVSVLSVIAFIAVNESVNIMYFNLSDFFSIIKILCRIANNSHVYMVKASGSLNLYTFEFRRMAQPFLSLRIEPSVKMGLYSLYLSTNSEKKALYKRGEVFFSRVIFHRLIGQ